MADDARHPRYAYRPSADDGARHPVVVVGGGMVGLTAALDLAQRGQYVVLLDEDDTVSIGSRAICHAKRTLEVFNRLGVGQHVMEQGVVWNTGRVFFHDSQVFAFDLLPQPGHQFPAFVNLQQYHLEATLVAACEATGRVDLRWRHRLVGLEPHDDHVRLEIETPDGPLALEASWLLAADGAHSLVRRTLDLSFQGRLFQDRFLIADVVMQAPFPAERWFWFEPPFHQGGSVLLHRQADDVWRIDFQLGWDADPDAERDPGRVAARVRAMLGPDVPFELEWVSVYTFRCRRLDRFRHGRILFLGDAAHQVSPFGARGGNGGVQDSDNLAWKLALVLDGQAPETLLDSYDAERIPATDENILNSTRATDFITPKTQAAHTYRDAVLDLARTHDFARALVNSGRLSRPARLPVAPLCTPDDAAWSAGVPPGAPAEDAPLLRDGAQAWLLASCAPGFSLLRFTAPEPAPILPTQWITPAQDPEGLAAQRYAAQAGTTILLRPDQHVAARWHDYDPARIRAALQRAQGAPC